MLNLPNKQELKLLESFDKANCITIYSSYAETAGAINPTRIKLRNLLHEAKDLLKSAGIKTNEIEATLSPANELIASNEFWPVHKGSFVLFMHPTLFRFYSVRDQKIPSSVILSRGFDLKYIKEAVQNEKPYFVLLLSHKKVRLLKGSNLGLKEVPLKDFPLDMKTVLRLDEYPQSWETHSIAPVSLGKGSEAFHGQYNVSQTDKKMLLEFFRYIDKQLHSYFYKKRDPLFIAGVAYLLPIYRRINTYHNLSPINIIGNFDKSNIDSIHDKVDRLIKSEAITPKLKTSTGRYNA